MSRVVSYSENRNRLASIAVFSDCGAYRYSLCRTWDRNLPAIMFLMLNPSTADEKANDPTIERCERRARAMGYGTLLVGNIFAYRSTDPGALYSHPAPEGKDNDAYLLESAKHAKTVICGWGTHGALHDRGERVRKMLDQSGIKTHALALNKNGSPKHPLYVAYSALPTLWEGEAK